jgi:hypothetical protein
MADPTLLRGMAVLLIEWSVCFHILLSPVIPCFAYARTSENLFYFLYDKISIV